MLGSVVSTYIGTAKPGSDVRVTEAYDLRDLVAADNEKNITGTGKRCWLWIDRVTLSNQSLSRHVQWDAPQKIDGMAESGPFWRKLTEIKRSALRSTHQRFPTVIWNRVLCCLDMSAHVLEQNVSKMRF